LFWNDHIELKVFLKNSLGGTMKQNQILGWGIGVFFSLLMCVSGFAKTGKTIDQYFQALPVSVFDDTTEGLTDEDKSSLIKSQDSSAWKSQKVSEKKIVVTCKRPTSIVTLRLKNLETELLEVQIQNEQVQTFQYWQFSADGQLQRTFPKLWLTALNEVSPEQDEPSLNLPADLKQHIDAIEACQHWMGEEAYDAARGKEIQANLTKWGCEKLDLNEATLRKKISAEKNLIKILDKAKSMTVSE